MDKAQAVDLIVNHSSRIAHLIGFDRLGEIHDGWIRSIIKADGDRTLQAHRGSYKTTCVCIAIANTMILRPRVKILYLRKTDSDIKEAVETIRRILSSDHYRAITRTLYGLDLSLSLSTASTITTNLCDDVKGTPQLTGAGIGGSLTGKHYDLIITDDIVNLSDRVSRAERERTKAIYMELRNIVNRGGRIFNAGTPWHPDDAFSLMPPPERYTPADTGLITAEELAEIRAGMTPSLFAANYELKHIASDDVLFSCPRTGGDPAMVENGRCHIDAGYYGTDYTALTIGRRCGDEIYIFGKLWRSHVNDCIDEIEGYYSRFLSGTVAVETNGDKGYLARDLRKRGFRVNEYHESTNKYLKISSYLVKAWRHIIFVDGTDEEYISQICDYTETAEHDDAPDSLASLVRSLDGGKAVPDHDRPRRGMIVAADVKGGWDG